MLRLDDALNVHSKALLIHEKRAEILANNLANQDTPGFKAKDIDFKETLHNALNNKPNKMQLHTTTNNHLSFTNNSLLMNPKYRLNGQPSLDGNTVDGQMEQSEFTQNSVNYLANLNFLNGKLRTIMSAIRGSSR